MPLHPGRLSWYPCWGQLAKQQPEKACCPGWVCGWIHSEQPAPHPALNLPLYVQVCLAFKVRQRSAAMHSFLSLYVVLCLC